MVKYIKLTVYLMLQDNIEFRSWHGVSVEWIQSIVKRITNDTKTQEEVQTVKHKVKQKCVVNYKNYIKQDKQSRY